MTTAVLFLVVLSAVVLYRMGVVMSRAGEVNARLDALDASIETVKEKAAEQGKAIDEIREELATGLPGSEVDKVIERVDGQKAALDNIVWSD